MKVIRWLGAFGKGPSLQDSLDWELTQSERSELAAEVILPGSTGNVDHCRVGLLVARKAVVRWFRGDVWSETTSDGRLRKTRSPNNKSAHTEAFVRPVYRGIVVYLWDSLSENTKRLLVSRSRRHGIPLLEMVGRQDPNTLKWSLELEEITRRRQRQAG